MIVTADSHGDFNATSQILRYSALAREVTVPRVPSINETILQANAAHASSQSAWRNFSHRQPFSSTPSQQHQRPPFFPPGSLSPDLRRTLTPVSPASSVDRVTMENAALEIARLTEEQKELRGALASEREARVTVEAHLLSTEDRMLELEQAIREDCVAEFEQRLEVELARWKAGMQMAIERGEEHWDRKIEVFERGLGLQEDDTEAIDDGGPENKENFLIENLEEENARLRREVTILKRELTGRSPSKRVPLAEREDSAASVNGSPRSGWSRHVSNNENMRPESLQRRIESVSLREGQENSRRVASLNTRANSKAQLDGAGGPIKRIRSRKLIGRKWEGGVDDGDDVF